MDTGDWAYLHRPKWVWCTVANVRRDRVTGENPHPFDGTKHFPGGSKVYVMPPQWGDGYERTYVIGKPRGNHPLRQIVMATADLENYRVKKVFSPGVIELMMRPYRHDTWMAAPRRWGDWGYGLQRLRDTAIAMNSSHAE